MSISIGRTDEEIERENRETIKRAILHFAGKKFDPQIEEMSNPIKNQKRTGIAESRPNTSLSLPSKTRGPAPQYPPWVEWGCVILSIILFIWGFCRG